MHESFSNTILKFLSQSWLILSKLYLRPSTNKTLLIKGFEELPTVPMPII